MRKARPERFRVALWDDPAGSTPLELPARRMWPAGLIVGAMFAIFAGILWVQIANLHPQGLRSVFDLSRSCYSGCSGSSAGRWGC